MLYNSSRYAESDSVACYHRGPTDGGHDSCGPKDVCYDGCCGPKDVGVWRLLLGSLIFFCNSTGQEADESPNQECKDRQGPLQQMPGMAWKTWVKEAG